MDRGDSAPAGWYDDPAQPGGLRFWDGAQWTAETRPAGLATESMDIGQGRTDRYRWDWKWLFLSFEGRAHRAHFWGGGFALSGISILLTIVLVTIASTAGDGTRDFVGVDGPDLAVIMLIIGLLVFAGLNVWAGLAIQVKRWHDRDKSGWWVLIGLIPYIGWLWVLIEAGMLPGTPGPNQYGPDPRL